MSESTVILACIAKAPLPQAEERRSCIFIWLGPKQVALLGKGTCKMSCLFLWSDGREIGGHLMLRWSQLKFTVDSKSVSTVKSKRWQGKVSRTREKPTKWHSGPIAYTRVFSCPYSVFGVSNYWPNQSAFFPPCSLAPLCRERFIFCFLAVVEVSKALQKGN